MGRKCETVDDFDAKLKENGAEMADYFVRTLLTIIHAILPPRTKEKSEIDSKEGDKSGFSALKIKDSRDRVKELEREIEDEARKQINGEEEEKRKHRDSHRDRRERKMESIWGRERKWKGEND
ncbi:unnamed protein product [Fraxinus pennsylvanica]|uniref:Uncharacterized protein n=1 Tax=Fraxinus pennsylvanica TaxID=56036 RepID=A0AAD1ZGT0_9LAMI|nr:unnamed protein product [Fraxinus pennsylvanica]